MSYTRNFARFASRLTFEELPSRVIAKAKLCILDVLGCALVGSEFPICKVITNLMRESGGKEEATDIRGAGKVPALRATFSNTMVASTAGISDTHFESSCHPGRGVVFASLAAAEKEDATGKDVITAITVGYEVAIRVCMALGPSSVYRRGFHSSMIGLPFGCAIGTGKILKLDENHMVNALGLVDLWEPRMKTKALKESPSFFLKYAGSAHNGFLAALIAREKVTGSADVLDDEEGFYKIFSGDYDLPKLTKDLGREFEIMNVCFKKYASCHHIEPALDALFGISDQYNSGEIKEIRVKVPSVCYNTICADKIIPPNSISAMFGGQYLMAVATLRKELFLNYRIMDYLDKMRNDPEVKELAKKVKLISDPNLDRIYPEIWGAVVEVETKRGRVINRVDLNPEENQVTHEEVEDKFRKITNCVIDSERANKIIENVYKLEEIGSIAELGNLLR